MTVAAILAEKGRDVRTTSSTASVAEAIDLLSRHRIGALVVVDGARRITGIVSERDIVHALARGGADALATEVGSIMTRAVITCAEGETVNDVMTRMTRGRFRHLPVVAGGRLAGIISIGDVVKARIEQVEREAEEMRAYIATA
ncbi:MAG: CBS domain-containing protein [Bauldia sp.]